VTTPKAEAVLEGLRVALREAMSELVATTHAEKEALIQAEAARLWGCEPSDIQVHYDDDGRVLQVRFPPEKTIIVLTIKPEKEGP
jgi:predicted nuclease with RNAse H fold